MEAPWPCREEPKAPLYPPEAIQPRHMQAGQAIERMKFFTEQVLPSREKLVELRRQGGLSPSSPSSSNSPRRPHGAADVRPGLTMRAHAMHGFAPPAMPEGMRQASGRKETYRLPPGPGRPARGSMRPEVRKQTSSRWAKQVRKKSVKLDEEFIEPSRTQSQRVEFVKTVGVRAATELMREQRKREVMAESWRQHQQAMQDVPTEGRHLQAYLTQTEDPGNFLYIPSREHLGRQEAEDFRDPTQDVKEHAEPVKVLGELVKVDPADRAASRPPSQASTAAGTFSRPPTAGDSRPSSAVVSRGLPFRPSSAVARSTRPASARPATNTGDARPSSAVPRSTRPASARPPSTGDTWNAGDARLDQMDAPWELEMEVAEINGEAVDDVAVSGSRLRTSRVSGTSAHSEVEFLYEGQPLGSSPELPDVPEPEIAPPSPKSEALLSPRPPAPVAKSLEEEDSEEDSTTHLELKPMQGYFSILAVRELFDLLDEERKGFVTRRELLFALNARQEVYRAFCRFYIQVEEEYMYWCDQVGQDPLPPGGVPPPEADNPRFVDDWRHVRREVEVRETEWQGEVKRFIFQDLERSLAGRKSLIIRKSLEFLDEACKQTALLRAPQAVAVLHQKCNKITLEILVNYFKMQGLLMEFRTAPILSTLPADLPSWVDQEPVLSLEDRTDAQEAQDMAKDAVDAANEEEELGIQEETLDPLAADDEDSASIGETLEDQSAPRRTQTLPNSEEEVDDVDEVLDPEDSDEESLQAALRAADEEAAEAFQPGVYVTTCRCLVLRTFDVIEPQIGDIITEFQAGKFFNAMSFQLVPQQRRLRAALAQPADGWIDVIDFGTNQSFVERAEPSAQVQYHPRKHDGTDDEKELAPLYTRKEDGPGLYVLKRMVFVSPSCGNVEPHDAEIVDELDEGTLVRVEEVAYLRHERRVRARIAYPAGWITLFSQQTRRRFAAKVDEQEEENSLENEMNLWEEEDARTPSRRSNAAAASLHEEDARTPSGRSNPSAASLHEEDARTPSRRSNASAASLREEDARTPSRRSNASAASLHEEEDARTPSRRSNTSASSLHEEEDARTPSGRSNASEDARTPSRRSNTSESLQAALRAADEEAAEAFQPGVYVTTCRCLVLRTFDVIEPQIGDIITEFQAGKVFNAVSFQLVPEQRRLRAALAQPADCWIDVIDFGTDQSFVERAEPSTQEDGPGIYVLKRMVFVSPSCENVEPDDAEIVDELDEGTLVRVEEVAYLRHERRVRARIAYPAGWITLFSEHTRRRCAAKVNEQEEETTSENEMNLWGEDDARTRSRRSNASTASLHEEEMMQEHQVGEATLPWPVCMKRMMQEHQVGEATLPWPVCMKRATDMLARTDLAAGISLAPDLATVILAPIEVTTLAPSDLTMAVLAAPPDRLEIRAPGHPQTPVHDAEDN
ncbi:unnamed protein product [Durusdinium trenchii]|uniref:EF-hand domain-containing protein n=1 Tax=Durusdinium trenchii TaxID=1381693 RepID=A0ABP0RVA8_9DINO